MDFTEEEILQRFVRGINPRTTEGSGLGLSIAESFMNSFGGRLKVSIRGDAFTVTLSFAAAPQTRPICRRKTRKAKGAALQRLLCIEGWESINKFR